MSPYRSGVDTSQRVTVVYRWARRRKTLSFTVSRRAALRVVWLMLGVIVRAYLDGSRDVVFTINEKEGR